MNDDVKRLRTLADTYKLSRPLPPALQEYVIANRMPDLRLILKKAGRYSLISWFVIMIFTLFRKYGIHITMIQSKIIAGVTAAAVASGSAAGAYRGTKYIIEKAGRPEPRVEETILEQETETQMQAGQPPAPAEQERAEIDQTVPVRKNQAPAETKQPLDSKQDKVKKKGKENNAISDIPSL